MLTFKLKTTFFTVKTSNEVYCCRIYFVNYIQNVHIIKRTLHGSSKIWILCSRGKNNISLVRCAHSPLEHKIHIFSQPCNILYIFYAWVAVSERMYRKNTPPLLPVHAFFRVFYTETLNCSELFASIKLFGVINNSFNFV